MTIPSPVRIRATALADAPGVWALEHAVLADGRGVVQLAAELPSLEVYEGRMLGRLSDREGWLVAEQDGRIVGQAALRGLGPSLLAHVAILSVEVHPDAQRLGIGRALCEAVIRAAVARGILRLELYVRADNPRAISLYTSLGFERESVRTRFVRLPDGTFVDDLCMVRFLDASAG